MLTVEGVLKQIKQWQIKIDHIEDLIDFAYTKVDGNLEEGNMQEMLNQINEWKQIRDKLEDLVDSTYWKLEELMETENYVV